jgi:hypothetical protein
MNGRLNDYRTLWNVAVLQRDTRALGIAAWIVGVVATLSIFGFVWRQDWSLVIAAIALSIGAMLIVTMILFAGSAALMNTPANARLMPRMRRRMIEITLLGWLCMTVLGGVFLRSWPAAILVAMWIISISMARGGSRVGNVLAMVPPMWGIIQRYLPAHLVDFLITPAALALELPSLLLLALWAIHEIFPNGGDRHYAQRGRQIKNINRGDPTRKDYGVAEVSALGRMSYGFSLRRDCEKRDRRALMLHVLGPQVHWALYWRNALLVLGVGLLVNLVMAFWITASVPSGVGIFTILMIGLLNVVTLAVAEAIASRIQSTRAEQGLYLLAPASPGTGAALNRQLAPALARNVSGAWLAVTAAVMGLTFMSGTSERGLLVAACTCSITLLPSIAHVLRDYARQTAAPGGAMIGWLVFLGAVVGGICYALADNFGGLAWPLMALAINLAAAVWAWSRWKGMLAAPPAFPVGHAAQ